MHKFEEGEKVVYVRDNKLIPGEVSEVKGVILRIENALDGDIAYCKRDYVFTQKMFEDAISELYETVWASEM